MRQESSQDVLQKWFSKHYNTSAGLSSCSNMMRDFFDADRLHEGLVNIVNGKITMSADGETLWNSIWSVIPDIKVLNLKAFDSYYGQLNAMTEVSINGDAINIDVCFEKDQVRAPCFLEPHLPKVKASAVDYIKRKKKVWEGKRFQGMISYGVVRNGNNSSPLGNVVFEMAKAMQAEYIANPPANQQYKINTDAVIQAVSPKLHKDFMICHYTPTHLVNDKSAKDNIPLEIERFTENKLLQRGSWMYDIWSAIQDGKGNDLKAHRNDNLWNMAMYGLLDVYNGTITWKDTVLKELYEKHEQNILDMFKDAKAWRLSYFHLNEATVAFEHQTMDGGSLTITYGPGYRRYGDSAAEALIKILKKHNLVPELYKRLGEYISPVMATDLTEQLLKNSEAANQAGDFSIRNLLSNI